MSGAPRGRLAVLVSGSGRTLTNLLDRCARPAGEPGALHAEVVLVLADRACRGIEIGETAGVPARVVTGEIPAEALGSALREARADLVVLAGYLRKVHVPEGFAGRVLNIHPALLPSFGGRGMYGHRVHEAVLKASREPGGPRESGCTVHEVTAGYDEGPILAQARCPVLAGDTPESLAARVFELELELYPRVLGERLTALGGSARS